MVDQNADGLISEDDVAKMLQQLGPFSNPIQSGRVGRAAIYHNGTELPMVIPHHYAGQNASPSIVSSYLVGAGNNRSINFTTFLTMVWQAGLEVAEKVAQL